MSVSIGVQTYLNLIKMGASLLKAYLVQETLNWMQKVFREQSISLNAKHLRILQAVFFHENKFKR